MKVPAEVNIYYVVSFLTWWPMALWLGHQVVFARSAAVTLGDWVLFILILVIFRYASHVRRAFGAHP